MEPSARLNAPPHGASDRTTDLQGTFVYMSDNALLASMTVSDVHFVPNRAALNELGRERLSRLVALMDSYGGTIRLNSDEADERLVDQRVMAVLQFLSEAGVDTRGSEVVKRDLSGGRGLNAEDAILIKLIEGSYRPKAGAGAAGPSASPGAGAGAASPK